jgi:hypothetical protein
MSVRTSSASRNTERLAERRRRHRSRVRIALAVLALVLILLALIGLNQSAVRVSRVDVFGTTYPLEPLAREALRGSYAFIIPHDSIFFLPKQSIREHILRAYPSIAAVSIFRSGLTSVSIRVTSRTPVARWCGDTYHLSHTASTTEPSTEIPCYYFDTSGHIFGTSTDSALLNETLLYEPFAALQAPRIEDRVLPNANLLPDVFKMSRELSTMGARIAARIMYVLGKEVMAFTALNATKDTVPLADGSLEYVDLRFDGKLYLKRKGASVTNNAEQKVAP